MKRIISFGLIAALLLALLSSCGKSYGTLEENTIKIVSYNIRCGDDGEGKNISDRGPRFQELMERIEPDIIGIQEFTPSWMEYFYDSLDEKYDNEYQWRGGAEYEATPIYWKRDKFELLDTGYFWLNEHPDEQGIGWDASYNRICMWVKLRLKETGREFLFYNTHFDFTETCHINSAKLITEHAKSIGGFDKYPVFCTGDFNMQPFTPGYTEMYKNFADVNFQLDEDETPTSNGYNESEGGVIIDYCFYSPELATPLKYQVLNEKINGGYISDHRGLYIEASVVVE